MTTEPFEPVAPEPEPIPEAMPAHPAIATAGTARSARLLVNGVLAVAFAVLIGGVAFAAGRATAPATSGAAARTNAVLQDGGGLPAGDGQRAQDGTGRFPGGFGGDDGFGRRGLGGSIQGTVVSISSTSLTIKLADGRTVDIAIDSGTGYHRQADATAGDVSAGSTVIVNLGGLASNGQGTGPTASSITIVP
jgi:hypothetical protein